MDIHSLNQKELAECMGVTVRTIANWGCPRTKQKTYNLPDVVAWKIDQVKLNDTDKEKEQVRKLQAQTEKLNIEISRMKNLTYSRDKVHSIAKKQAIELRQFWSETWKRNTPVLLKSLGLSVNERKEFLKQMDLLISQMMETFIKSGINVSDL